MRSGAGVDERAGSADRPPSEGDMNRVLAVEDLRIEFAARDGAVTAVDSVSFHITEGESVGLVGESGCGKTTTGLAIMGLLPSAARIAAGSIRLLGRDLVSLPESAMCKVRGDQVGMIFQDPLSSLHPLKSVGSQIAEAVQIHRDVSKAEARTRALEVLDLVEIPQAAQRYGTYPHQLSGGLRQRVMIAMALACEPKLLIADEPTTALDVTIQAQILDLIGRLREDLRMAVLLITHDMGVIAGHTDRVQVMYAGQIIEGADTEELFGRIRHPYSEALMASVPRLDQDPSVRLAGIPGAAPDLSEEIHHCRFAARCSHATAECFEREPVLEQAERASSGHLAACFHQGGLGRPRVASDADAQPVPAEELAAGLEVPNVSDPVVQPPGALPILSLEHLVREFPLTSGMVLRRRIATVSAVADVCFDIQPGETFGLVGESGSGKTTVGRLAVALDRPTSGAVRIENQVVDEMSRATLRRKRRDFQMMFQDPYASLDPRMRVGAILQEPLAVQGVGNRAERGRVVRGLLDEVGLPAKSVDRYPHEFSGGQRQRIGLARALMLNPKLIVADEPVSALDVAIQAQILNLLKELQRARGLTYLFISHDLAVVRYMADRIGVMYLGKLVEVGPAANIYRHSAHHYTRALIDAIPVPDVAKARAHEHPHIGGELPSATNPPSGCRFRTRCPAAQQICADKEPAMQRFGAGHHAACHFPLQRLSVAEPDNPTAVQTS
jgi:peptide/nickel transport system ATP-binding protein